MLPVKSSMCVLQEDPSVAIKTKHSVPTEPIVDSAMLLHVLNVDSGDAEGLRHGHVLSR